MEEDRERYFVQSFARGLEVIQSFCRAQDRLTVAELAELTGLHSAAARRFVLTLNDLGYLRSEGRHYALTTKVLELGHAYLTSNPLHETVKPQLDELVDTIVATTSLRVLDAGVAVPDRDAVVYIAYARAESLFVLNVSAGSSYPAWVASTGRVLLSAQTAAELDAYLDKVELVRYTCKTVTTKAALRCSISAVAEQGWAMVDQEFDERLCSYAVPIHDDSHNVIAALNLSVMHDDDSEQHSAVVIELEQTAARIRAQVPRRSGADATG
ncbi:IclR family transcriptional regulator C-terminal domain-containing protein [Mycolicibacterium sp. YH-1]|uniref:IclR family transcriptional regulator domain-containing protein n=1 Tax=Mycolicibacterium sp. YH-1 TaxID=2908837 RepID=UPI001F4BFAE9|nr:IclR family transcriptional regulator C-terminal domain-containing protein [Mycolicibacterium sp. YH-1]UNB50809.1 helix-turn-helix domain-containing protein [Mycolicibacterium sp. YH-1]